ncbi:tetratricopeptide repeat protein [candidate division KSB1 bacterium]|nr:tetratricopeptide repeat protein [candidate division KSB1 bacterium]
MKPVEINSPQVKVMTSKTNVFMNQSVVFTGQLSSMTRKEAQNLTRQLGGATPPALARNTTYLVIGNGGYLKKITRSQKLKRAEELNEKGAKINIISENLFLEMVGLDTEYKLENKYYVLSDIIKLYPNLRNDRIRYFQRWGLLKPAIKTNTSQYFEFKDLLIFRKIDGYLKQGKPLLAIAKGLRNQIAPIKQLRLPFEEELPRGRILEFRQPSAPQKSVEEWYDIGYENDTTPETYDKAIDAYKNALKLDPNFVPAAINLGNIYYEKGEREKARDLYLHALKLEPHNYKIFFNLGNLYDDLNDFSTALSYFNQAIQQQPLYADAHFNIAIVYEKIGMKQEAQKHWKLYLKIDSCGEWAEIAREHLKES